MSLVVPGRGKTTTVKPRRPRPKPAMPIGGNRPKPVLKPAGPTTKPKRPLVGRPTSSGGGKRRPNLGGKVTPRPGIVNDKPTPKAPSRPKRPLVGRPTSSGGGKRRPTPSMPASRPKRPLRAPKRGSGRPMNALSRRPRRRR